MAEYIIYTKPDCPYCVRAKELAEALNLNFRVIDLNEHPTLRKEFKRTGVTTVPQVITGLHRIGGYEDFVAYLDDKGIALD